MSFDDYREELELFRSNTRRFAESEIFPKLESWDNDHDMPRDIWNKLGEAGLLCVDVPGEYGGSGVPASFSAVVLEELARIGAGSLSTQVVVHSDIIAHYILNLGSEEQKNKYLPRMVAGECVGAIAMSEPAAGSDLQGIRTTAKSHGSGYLINGSKTFISNGLHCDIAVTAARTNTAAAGAKGTSLFIVDTTTSGFSRGKRLDKIGLHASDTMELFYENVRVSDSALLGELNMGFSLMMQELPRERWAIAVTGIAASEAALQWTIDYVQERQAFGKPLAGLQTIRHKIAEFATEIKVHRAFVDNCTQLLVGGVLDTATASMAKLSCTELQGRIVDGCLQLFGGYGYMREYPIARAFVDARVQRIYGGTSEIMKEIISRSVLGRL